MSAACGRTTPSREWARWRGVGAAAARRRALAAWAALWVAAGCASAPLSPGVLTPGQDVEGRILDPAAVDTWTARTAASDEAVVLRIRGNPVEVGMLRVQVALAGGVVVARLQPERAAEFAIALSGRPADWRVDLRLGPEGSAPVRYRMFVARVPSAGGGPRASCGDALGARGVSAWVVSPASLTAGAPLALPGLGLLTLGVSGPGSAGSASPSGGAPVTHLPAATVLHGDFAALGCDLHRVQVNLWDTGRGKPPALVVADAAGRRLCGEAGQPACPVNPRPSEWVTWSLSAPAPIRRLSLESDDLFLSSIVIQ